MRKPGVIQIYSTSTWEFEAESSVGQGHPLLEQQVRGQPRFCATLSQDTKQYENKFCVWNMAALFQGSVS